MAPKKKKKNPGPPRHLKAKHRWKEQWLNEAMVHVRRHFTAVGYDVPEHVRISTGWPSQGGTSKKSRRIGETWTPKCSADGVHEIIISLYLDDPEEVVAVLIHEVAHTVVGVEHGHRKPFAECAAAVGLVKPWTSTSPSEGLKLTLAEWAKDLGQYPHAKLDGGSDTKKQGTRLLKMECERCGCVIRTTAKWIDEYGDEWPCPCSGTLTAD